MVSFFQKRDLLRDKGRDNKRRSMPSQIHCRMSPNSCASAVLVCTWSPTTASDRAKAKHFRVINELDALIAALLSTDENADGLPVLIERARSSTRAPSD